MAYIDYKDLLEQTNYGLQIITMYYPDAANALTRKDKKFKIREERTASASIRLKGNSYWVTDFGGDQKERNAIGVCMFETGKSFVEAVNYLGSVFKVKGASTWVEIKPEWSKRPLKEGESYKDYDIEPKEFTDEELSILGPKVNESHCKDYNLVSLKSFTFCKETEATITSSTDSYPIFSFEHTKWSKVYQPLSFDKSYRFRFLGDKPKRFIYGLDLIKKAYNKQKEIDESNYDPDSGNRLPDSRIDYVFIVSGGSDGLNLRSFGYYAVWFNSESEKLTHEEHKMFLQYAKEIIYVPDLDASGLKHALEISLKFLDIRIMMLPNYLAQRKDKRGNSCKDFKDFVVHFYDHKKPVRFSSMLNKLIENAIPAQFWSETLTKGQKKYHFRNTQFFNFLKLNGFGRIKDDYTKEGFHFARIDGNIIKKTTPVEVEAFVNKFLYERQAPIPLRDLVYGQNLSDNKLKKMDAFKIKFSSSDKDNQFMFFENSILQINKDDIKLKRRGEVDKYIWDSKKLEHNIFLTDRHFTIKKDKHGNDDIEIHVKDNMFFNYLTNASRIHWRKELETNIDDLKPADREKYKQENKFNIAGPNLSKEEQYEQKQHLINKIFALGYMIHTFKSPQKPWAVYAMDNKLADVNESHGGSGKSVFQKAIQQVLKKNHYIPGRDSKKTSDDFITHGITPDTDYILVDDCNQYLDYGFFFSWITGDLEVNNKNGLRFVIPFDEVPKIAFSSNYPPNNLDPSLARRLLYIVFSDYYHFNLDEEYRETRAVSDDFDGKSLFKDFDDVQWNKFYNFMAECVRFFLSREDKVNPPMANVTMRNLLSEMGVHFKEWADVYFQKTNITNQPLYKDNFVVKDEAFEDFRKQTGFTKFSSTKFKRALKAYAKYNEWDFNPTDVKGYQSDGRIMHKVDKDTKEMFYMRTKTTTQNDVLKESSNTNDTKSDEIDDDLPF